MNMLATRRSPLLNALLFCSSFVIIVAGMYAAAPILSPLLLALFLAVLLYPPYKWLLQRGIPTWLAVTVMVLGVMIVGVSVLALLWVSIEQLRSNLFLYAARLVAQRIRLEAWLAGFGLDVPDMLSLDLINRQFVLTTAARILANLGTLLFTGFFVLVTTVFLLIQATHLSERLRRELGADSWLHMQAVIVAQRVAQFFTIRVRVNLIVAGGITIWLFILGVDLAILWGILAFFLSFVMYVGLAVAAVPPVLLALAESGPLFAILVIIGVIVINSAVENVVAPSMMGQGLNLAPVVVLVSIVFWAWVLGPLGFILAIPLTVIVVMILASYKETHWMVALLTMDSLPTVQPVVSTAESAGIEKIITTSPKGDSPKAEIEVTKSNVASPAIGDPAQAE
jgi:AI-2 transport protein TqsA